MTRQLAELGRLTWALDECAETLSGRRRVVVPEEQWWKMGDVRKLTRRSRGVAQEVAASRERRAVALTGPGAASCRTWLCWPSPSVPGTAGSSRGCGASTSAIWAAAGPAEILGAVQRGLALAPEEIRLPPEGRETQAPAVAVAVCTALVRQIADDLQFDQGLLATRADITNLLCGEPSRLDHGWRSSIAGDPSAAWWRGRWRRPCSPTAPCCSRNGRSGPCPCPSASRRLTVSA